jgi:hypothetical protein
MLVKTLLLLETGILASGAGSRIPIIPVYRDLAGLEGGNVCGQLLIMRCLRGDGCPDK